MFKIVAKKDVTPNVKYFEVHAPAVAHKSKPGQFVIVRAKETGERLPITIAGTDSEKGTVEIYFAEVGKSSTELGALEEGESILNFAGPLGNSVKIENYGNILCVGGGVFVGAMLYQIRAFKETGNHVTAVFGYRNKDHVMLEDEVKAVQSFIDAKVEYEARLHVCHVSCATTARLIYDNRAEDTLTAEVTPHHLFLTGGDFPHDDGLAKMLPPLRSPYDNKMLMEALCKTCAIDCVASDHAPHKKWEKTAPFLKASSGIPGLETTVPLMLTEVFEKHMAWIDYLRVCSSAPARILGLETKGILTKGFDADIVLARIQEGTISGRSFFSKAKITPFEGRRVLARVVTTIVGGVVVFDDGKFVTGPGIAGVAPVQKS